MRLLTSGKSWPRQLLSQVHKLESVSAVDDHGVRMYQCEQGLRIAPSDAGVLEVTALHHNSTPFPIKVCS